MLDIFFLTPILKWPSNFPLVVRINHPSQQSNSFSLLIQRNVEPKVARCQSSISAQCNRCCVSWWKFLPLELRLLGQQMIKLQEQEQRICYWVTRYNSRWYHSCFHPFYFWTHESWLWEKQHHILNADSEPIQCSQNLPLVLQGTATSLMMELNFHHSAKPTASG